LFLIYENSNVYEPHLHTEAYFIYQVVQKGNETFALTGLKLEK